MFSFLCTGLESNIKHPHLLTVASSLSKLLTVFVRSFLFFLDATFLSVCGYGSVLPSVFVFCLFLNTSFKDNSMHLSCGGLCFGH